MVKELEQVEQEGKAYRFQLKGIKEQYSGRLGQISGFLGLNENKRRNTWAVKYSFSHAPSNNIFAFVLFWSYWKIVGILRVDEMRQVTPLLLIAEFLSLLRLNDEWLNLWLSCKGLGEVHLVSTLCKVSYFVLLNSNGKRTEFMIRKLKCNKCSWKGLS